MVETRRKKAANKEVVAARDARAAARGAQAEKTSTEPERLDAADKQTSGVSKVSPAGDNWAADYDLTDLGRNLFGKVFKIYFQAKTFAEVAKSPRSSPTKKRSGFKPQIPKAEGQQTLEEAFQAGALYQEAKEIKKKALMAKDEIEVSFVNPRVYDWF